MAGSGKRALRTALFQDLQIHIFLFTRYPCLRSAMTDVVTIHSFLPIATPGDPFLHHALCTHFRLKRRKPTYAHSVAHSINEPTRLSKQAKTFYSK